MVSSIDIMADIWTVCCCDLNACLYHTFMLTIIWYGYSNINTELYTINNIISQNFPQQHTLSLATLRSHKILTDSQILFKKVLHFPKKLNKGSLFLGAEKAVYNHMRPRCCIQFM